MERNIFSQAQALLQAAAGILKQPITQIWNTAIFEQQLEGAEGIVFVCLTLIVVLFVFRAHQSYESALTERKRERARKWDDIDYEEGSQGRMERSLRLLVRIGGVVFGMFLLCWMLTNSINQVVNPQYFALTTIISTLRGN